MAFFSAPLFLDPPNWQQPNPHLQGGADGTLHLPPSPPPLHPGGGKIRQPEAPLKCPRCESTNTKFCYFNNYSRTQPRHFCKTCRRYWTAGGALRNVPVGGGCRRNRRRKTIRRPKSLAYHHPLPPPASQLSLTTSFQSVPRLGLAGSLGEFHQLPFLAGFGAGTLPFNASLYAFQSEGILGMETAPSYGGKGSQLAPVKMESVVPFAGGLSGGLWMDPTGVSSSCTTSHIL